MRQARGEVTLFAVVARDESAPCRICFGVVGNDEAAGSTNHVETNQLAPVVKLIALLNGENRVDPALMFALKLGFGQSEFAHEAFRPNSDIGFFVDEQAQLARQVGFSLVVRRSRQQDDLRIHLFDVFRNRLVAPPFAVTQVMALVDEHQSVCLEVRQPFRGLRNGQHSAAQSILRAIALPHRLQILRADDERFVAEIVFEHAGEGRGHHGLAESDHVTNHHAPTAVQVPCRDLDGTFLELEQVSLKPCRQPKLAQAGTRFSAQVISDVEINMVWRDRLDPRPTALDDVGEIGRYVQGPALCPAGIEPLGEFVRRHVVKHIDVELALP